MLKRDPIANQFESTTMARPFENTPSTPVLDQPNGKGISQTMDQRFLTAPDALKGTQVALKTCLKLIMMGAGLAAYLAPQGIAYAQKAEPSGIIFADDPEEDDEQLDEQTGTTTDSKKDNPSALDGETGKNKDSLVGPPSPKVRKNQTSEGTSSSLGAQTSTKVPQSSPPFTKASEPRIFGEYRVRLGASKPTFSSDLKYYETLYGATSYYPSISADWFAFDWYATFGISLRSGFYTDEGKAGRGQSSSGETFSKENITDGNLQVDKQASTTLTLLPLQIAAIVQFTPFDFKWLVFDGWFGMERLYFQEVRAGSSVSSGKTLISTASDSNTVLTNNGFKNAVLYGFGANIRIDALDESTSASLGSMGLHAVYLTPSIEVIQQTDKGVNFSRRVTSLAFVFESLL
jgi:hypothetical protein